MSIDHRLLEILACPKCVGRGESRGATDSRLRLDESAAELVCTNGGCGLAYPIQDGIPVLLVDSARVPGGPAAQA